MGVGEEAVLRGKGASLGQASEIQLWELRSPKADPNGSY